MLDDLRNSAASSSFQPEEEPTPSPSERPGSGPRKASTFLGMTASQRFVVALLVLMMTCVLGTFLLLVTEKIALPFF